MKRILIVDDHPIVRDGIKNALENDIEMSICGEASDGFQAIKLVKTRKFDLVILDLNLPNMDGLETLQILKTVEPDLPVLILSMHSAEEYAIRALKSGASGYLPKDTKPRILIHALKKILSGGKYIPPSVAEEFIDSLGAKNLPRHENLSHREYQIMKFIGKGMTPREIASELSISPRTVGTYRSRIFVKMNFKSNSHIVKYCLEKKIIST